MYSIKDKNNQSKSIISSYDSSYDGVPMHWQSCTILSKCHMCDVSSRLARKIHLMVEQGMVLTDLKCCWREALPPLLCLQQVVSVIFMSSILLKWNNVVFTLCLLTLCEAKAPGFPKYLLQGQGPHIFKLQRIRGEI